MRFVILILLLPTLAQAEHAVSVSVQASLPGLPAHVCERVIWDALGEWDQHCGIAFERSSAGLFGLSFVTGTPVIDDKQSSGHASSFNGYPTLGGRIVLNPNLLDRRTKRPIAWDAAMLRRVVLHEVGHFMGRNHSFDPASVMYANPRVGRLGPGDIVEARKIWGEPE